MTAFDSDDGVGIGRPAGILRRVLAYWLDCTLLYSVLMAAQFFAFAPLASELDTSWRGQGWAIELYVLVTISAPAMLYFAWFDRGPARATIGKRVCGLRTVTTDGAVFALGRGVLRSIIKLLPWETAHLALNLPHNPFVDRSTGEFLGWETGEWRWTYMAPYVLLLIYAIALIADSRRRTVHDRVTATMVVRASGATENELS